MTDQIEVFWESLPEPLKRRGDGRANDVTLAKQMRTDMKAAIAAGVLPVGTEISVRINHYASLTVEIVAFEGAILAEAYAAHLLAPTVVPWDVNEAGACRARNGRRAYDIRRDNVCLSDALNDALALVERIAERHNYNNSDLSTDYFDVGYYLTVTAGTVESAAAQGIKLESDPTYRALVDRAMKAAKAVGPKAVKAICGSRGIEACGEWSLERLIKVADRANGRPVAFDKRRRGWFPVAEGAA